MLNKFCILGSDIKSLTLADVERMVNSKREAIVVRGGHNDFFEDGFLGMVERWQAGHVGYVVAQVPSKIGGIPSGKMAVLYIDGNPKEHGYLVELDEKREPLGIYEF